MMRASSFLRRLTPLFLLALVAAALLITPRPTAEAQSQDTTIWSATLAIKSLGTTSVGCSNDSTTANKCSTAATLTEDDITAFGKTGTTVTGFYFDSELPHLKLIIHNSSVHTAQLISDDIRNLTLHIGTFQVPLADSHEEKKSRFDPGSRVITLSGQLAFEVLAANVMLAGESVNLKLTIKTASDTIPPAVTVTNPLRFSYGATRWRGFFWPPRSVNALGANYVGCADGGLPNCGSPYMNPYLTAYGEKYKITRFTLDTSTGDLEIHFDKLLPTKLQNDLVMQIKSQIPGVWYSSAYNPVAGRGMNVHEHTWAVYMNKVWDTFWLPNGNPGNIAAELRFSDAAKVEGRKFTWTTTGVSWLTHYGHIGGYQSKVHMRIGETNITPPSAPSQQQQPSGQPQQREAEPQPHPDTPAETESKPPPLPELPEFVQRYDLDNNRWIDTREYIEAGKDFGSGRITRDELDQVKRAFLEAQAKGYSTALKADEPSNNPPTLTATFGDATIISTDGTLILVLASGDPDGDTVTVTASSSDQSVAAAAISPDGHALLIAAESRGATNVTVTADDGEGGTTSKTFTVTVKSAPDVASPIADVDDLVVDATQDVSLSGVFSDADGDSLTITAASSDEAKATVTVAADHSKLTLTGVAVGTATITVTARDSDGNTVSDAFDVTVNAPAPPEPVVIVIPQPPQQNSQPQKLANRAPTVANPVADASGLEVGATRDVSLSGTFSDADGDSLTITASSSDKSVATVSVSAGYSTLTVSAKSRGTATITVNADDGNGGSVDDAFNVTVKAAPVAASSIADVSALEVDATQEVSLSGVFSDADGDSLTITAASSDEGKVTVSVVSDGSKLTITGVAQGTATISVTARDSGGNTATDAFDVTVQAVQEQEQNQEQAPYADLISQMYDWRNDPQWKAEKAHTDRWDRALLAFGETVSDSSLTAMTASEAQGFADRGWTRWVPVAEALNEIEAAAQQPAQNQNQEQAPYADLISQMYDWRNDPQWKAEKAHTDRWDRALLAFGETVSDSSLTAMTASEAQGFADRGWTRWVTVAEALREIESQ